MAAHQCPYCPLRFAFRTEVEWHVDNEHRELKVEKRGPDDERAAPTPTDPGDPT
jgi:hypothetical protein